MASAEASFQIGDGPLFCATHVSVGRVGPEITSAFVYDDGLARDATGLSVIATLETVRTLAVLLDVLQRNSSAYRAALGRKQVALPVPPRPYVSVCEPLRFIFASVQVLEVHDVAYLAFAVIDPHSALSPIDPAAVKGPARVMAPRVSLALDNFVAWASAIAALSGKESR